MSSRLDRITDWDAVIVKCDFKLRKMAKKCGVSERTLRRYFRDHFRVRAKEWRDARRLEMAFLGLVGGEQIKAASIKLKFKHPENFSAFIKRQTGRRPIDYRYGKYGK
jgi:AraC-like DNA-binding protein